MIPRLLQQSSLCLSLRRQIRYTKKYFEDLNIDYASIAAREKEEAIRKHKEAVKALTHNDRNPNNFIKNLKVDRECFQHFEKIAQDRKVRECAILTPEPKKQPVLLSSTRKHLITSIKKATIALKQIRKLYFYDAITVLQSSDKKVCKAALTIMYNLVRHARERELDPVRLYVHGVIIGKAMRFKGVRYHAKGKGGREKRDMCQIKIILQQRAEEDFFGDVGTGLAPAGFASIIRQRLLSMNADYPKLQQLTGVTTSKGRQQKREILKRRVSLIMKENSKNAVIVPKKTIQKTLRAEEAKKAKQLFLTLKQTGEVSKLRRREIVYQKNIGTSS